MKSIRLLVATLGVACFASVVYATVIADVDDDFAFEYTSHSLSVPGNQVYVNGWSGQWRFSHNLSWYNHTNPSSSFLMPQVYGGELSPYGNWFGVTLTDSQGILGAWECVGEDPLIGREWYDNAVLSATSAFGSPAGQTHLNCYRDDGTHFGIPIEEQRLEYPAAFEVGENGAWQISGQCSGETLPDENGNVIWTYVAGPSTWNQVNLINHEFWSCTVTSPQLSAPVVSQGTTDQALVVRFDDDGCADLGCPPGTP